MPDQNARPIFLTEIEQFGGAERSLLALSRWLSEHHLANYLLTYWDRCNIARYASHPLEVVALDPPPGARNKVSALRRYLRSRPGAPALICSGYQPALHATLAGARGFHCLMHDTPALFGDQHTRSLKSHLRIAVQNRVIGYGLRSGGRTLVNSEFLRRDCWKDFRVKAEIARMGGLSGDQFAASPAKSKFASAGDRLQMLSVCRIEPNKRIDWMLSALAQLESKPVAPLSAPLSSLADWHLHLAGKGSLIQDLSRQAESLGIASRIHFHGFVADAELECLYADAHLFLMPAVQGYGIPAIEALRRGIPVLLHRESGVSDILLDTPWATVVHGGPHEFTPLLARAIEGILHGRHLAVPAPSLPTEDEWAQRVVELCGWS
jgi:glycosyltransferase involved in cell wall biosynthesis